MVHLGRLEAQDLDGGKLALALRDVGGREGEDHDKREARCHNGDKHNYSINDGEVLLKVTHVSCGRSAAKPSVLACLLAKLNLFFACAAKVREHSVFGIGSVKGLLVELLRHVDGVT